MSDRNQDRSRSGVRKWYHGNADEYNAARREKYANDPEARQKAVDRAREYRARRRVGGMQEFKPLYRYVNRLGNSCVYGAGTRVRVWTTGMVATSIGATPQMLRNWGRKGWIPLSQFSDTHRLYTNHQCRLIKRLAKFMVKYRKSPSKYGPKLAVLVDSIAAQWREAC